VLCQLLLPWVLVLWNGFCHSFHSFACHSSGPLAYCHKIRNMWCLMDVYIALRYSNEKRDWKKIVQHPQRKWSLSVSSKSQSIHQISNQYL
jgi:hypothetical protein